MTDDQNQSILSHSQLLSPSLTLKSQHFDQDQEYQ